MDATFLKISHKKPNAPPIELMASTTDDLIK
jgi:hypothetical protein